MELNKIHCMDALDGLKQLEDDSVDLVLTDPPYNLDKDFQNDNLKEEEFISFLTPILKELKRVSKPKRSIIIFFDSGKNLPLLFKCIEKAELHFQKLGVWYKPNDCSFPHNRILRKSEVFVIVSKTLKLNHDGEGHIHDCIIRNRRITDKSFWHPTVKELPVIEKLLLSHSLEKWIVLDPFMGSGTTAVACTKLGRKFIGFEIEQKYIEMANKRISQHRGQTRLTEMKL